MSEKAVYNKKQKLLLEYMLADKETFAFSYSILQPEYFEPPLDRAVEYVLEHFIKHADLPKLDMIDAEVGVMFKKRTLEPSEKSYLLEEIEQHCRTEAMDKAIMEAADMVGEGKLNQIESVIRNAMLVKIDKSVGVSLFDNPKERIETMDEDVVQYSTGIPGLDRMIGYLVKGEFGMVYAQTSGGKSLMLANIAIALARQGLDVDIVTLELYEKKYLKRMDSMFAGISIDEHQNMAAIISEKLLKERSEGIGNITVKFMPAGTTAGELSAHLLEYSLLHGKYPDAFLVDYLQIMGVEGMSGNNNKFDIDHEKSVALRGFGGKHDMIMLSAGQINREGTDVLKVTHAHVAGGLSVVNNSDWSVALVASEEDIDNNQVQAVALKQRNAAKTRKPLILYRCPKTLRFAEEPFELVKSNYTSPLVKKTKPNEALKGKDKLRKALKR